MIQNFSQFVEGFGKAKSGYSSSGAIGKSLGKGNKITHIPHGLEVYEPYLNQTQNALNVKWLKWQMDGKTYLDIADQCPYCSGSIDSTKETILKISDEYDSKSIEHLNKILLVFENLLPYFSDETAEKIKEISDNVEGITKPQQTYLIGVKEQVSSLLAQLQELKRIGFFSLKNSEKIADELKKYEIDLSYYFHLCSDLEISPFFYERSAEINLMSEKLNSGMEIPDYAIERIARCLLPIMQEYFESEEGQQELREYEQTAEE